MDNAKIIIEITPDGYNMDIEGNHDLFKVIAVLEMAKLKFIEGLFNDGKTAGV